MTSVLGMNLKRVREARKWSQAALAKKANVSQGAISHIENSTSENTRHLPSIAKALGVTTEYLTENCGTLDGSLPSLLEGYTIVSGERKGASPDPDEYVFIAPHKMRGGLERIAMGGDITINGGLVFKKDWIKSMGVSEDDLSTIYMATDSMSPSTPKGQALLINTADKTPKSSKVYLVIMNGEAYVKRFINMLDKWILRSDNPDKTAYPDIEISAEAMRDLQIEGRAVWQGGFM